MPSAPARPVPGPAAGDTLPKTGPGPRRHHQHHDPGAPGQPERHEPPDSVRSNALNVRFQDVRRRTAASTPNPSRRQSRRTESPHPPTGIRAPSPGALAPPRRMPRKYDFPFSAIGFPWIHNLSPGAEAVRIHESGTVAFGCSGRGSGCPVSASRHLPAAALGKSPSGAVSFTSSRIDRPKSLSCRPDN